MRIGILTIHHVMNYGAVWQAYSLSKALTRLGAQVEIIDYRPLIATEFYRQPLFKRRRLNLAGVFREQMFSHFQKHRLPLGPSLCYNAEDLAVKATGYDMVVAGSDQIWCTGAGSFRGYDPNFFLDFLKNPAVAKISYAASAGNTADFAEHNAVIGHSLRKFKALSVRDRSTGELVERASGVKPELVLDPVFLNRFEEFKAADHGDMIIFARNPQRLKEIAGTILKQSRMRVVSIGKKCDFADVNHKFVTPVQWLKKMKGARVILTDYFHGAAVALRFGCPFVVNAPPDKVVKITDMLSILGLTDHFQEESPRTGAAIQRAVANPEAFKQDVFERLKSHEERSFNFLQNAIRPSSHKPILQESA